MVLEPAGIEHLAFVVRAGTHPEITDATYVPPAPDPEGAAARAWLAEREAYLITVTLADRCEVAGLIALRTPVDAGSGLTIPESSAEFERFLFPEWRGRGLASAALRAVLKKVAGRYRYLIGVAWASNRASIRSIELAGGRHLGRSWWTCPTASGWCEVYCLPVPE